MSLVYVRQIILNGKKTFEVERGISPYTPFTTHYDLDDSMWNLPLTTNAVRSVLIHCKIKGKIPPNSSLPIPPIKRKL